MYEVERKVETAHPPVRRALEGADARFLGTVHQRDIYFDHPVRDLAVDDEALRIREETVLAGDGEDEETLTYKGPRLETSAKARIEREIAIDDADAMIATLEALDFVPAGTVEKERERYLSPHCEICLDQVEGLGEFVEIERRGPTEDVADAAETTRRLLAELDLTEATMIPESYLTLVLSRSE